MNKLLGLFEPVGYSRGFMIEDQWVIHKGWYWAPFKVKTKKLALSIVIDRFLAQVRDSYDETIIYNHAGKKEELTCKYYPAIAFYAPRCFVNNYFLCILYSALFRGSVQRYIVIEFNKELGAGRDTWKGGVLSDEYPLGEYQSPEAAFLEWANQDLYRRYSR
jgi:hypothetical protein